jgi:hypothetical protein
MSSGAKKRRGGRGEEKLQSRAPRMQKRDESHEKLNEKQMVGLDTYKKMKSSVHV